MCVFVCVYVRVYVRVAQFKFILCNSLFNSTVYNVFYIRYTHRMHCNMFKIETLIHRNKYNCFISTTLRIIIKWCNFECGQLYYAISGYIFNGSFWFANDIKNRYTNEQFETQMLGLNKPARNYRLYHICFVSFVNETNIICLKYVTNSWFLLKPYCNINCWRSHNMDYNLKQWNVWEFNKIPLENKEQLALNVALLSPSFN